MCYKKCETCSAEECLELKEIVIFSDGGSLSNGTEDQVGYGSFAVYLGDPTGEGGELKRTVELSFGAVTNNAAEHLTLLGAAKYAVDLAMRTENYLLSFIFRSDSELLVKKVMGVWPEKARDDQYLQSLRNIIREEFAKINFPIVEQITGDEMKRVLGH
jgi:ribonuclease HI